MSTPDDILEFWFPPDAERANAMWWGKNPELDAEIAERFGATLRAAKAGELDAWAASARGRLALIIVLDQFSRNILRGDPETYAADDKARALTLDGLALGHDRELPFAQRVFFYLPLEHSESLADQDRCVALMEAMAAEAEADPEADAGTRRACALYVDYAQRHRDVIARYGRFPHRNALLGRTSTADELEYLAQPGAGF